MKIFEIAGITNTPTPSPDKLLGLVQFLAGRAEDSQSQKEISQDAFISLAQSLGINVTKANLSDLTNQEPLSNVLEPIDPGSGVVRFKGNVEGNAGMTVDQARAVVDSNAKAALKRRQ